MYTCSDDSTVRIWDMLAGTNESFILYKHTDRSLCMDLSPDGAVLATGGADKVIKVCDLVERKVITTLEGFTNSV